MNFYGVVGSRLSEAVELFLRREDAEWVVPNWDRDEPAEAGLLRIEPIELDVSPN